MAMLRGEALCVVMVIFAIGLLFSRELVAAPASVQGPNCMKNGEWVDPGTPCGPRGFTCQRIGRGPALTCRAARR